MAEAIFNHHAPEGWTAQSAGSHPAGVVNPMTLETLRRHDIDTESLASKSWDHLPTTPDIVITLCSQAAGETCPAYLGPVIRAHWGMDDPSEATGPTDAQIAAFEQAFARLTFRIEQLLAHRSDLEQASRDEAAEILARIGKPVP